MNVLLVEPKSSTIYPPLGLMKIATYHKLKGDNVKYVVGKDKKACIQFWDRIYITTVFTYDLKNAVETVKFYSKNLFNFKNIQIGGVAATLMPEYITNKTGIAPHLGLLDNTDDFLANLARDDSRFFYLSECIPCIDNLPPDYSIFPEETKYSKLLETSYMLYSTKGCPNKCDFCAVKTLEPKFINYIPIKPRVDYINDNFGEKANLILLDNNIAASDNYYKIIEEICEIGFSKDAQLEYGKKGKIFKKKKSVDFNQGIDARLMDKAKMRAMARTCINPLRLAFDDIKFKDIYLEKVKIAIECGIKDISNYMLYNHKDTPEDLYARMVLNTKIKENNKDIRIFSFPMRFSPIMKTNRAHVGKNWHRRQIRAFQTILNATHGIVSHKSTFFYRAFGRNIEEFLRLLAMPLKYIINRDLYEKRIPECFPLWNAYYSILTPQEKDILMDLAEDNQLKSHYEPLGENLAKIFSMYIDDKNIVIPIQDQANEIAIFREKYLK